MISLPKFFSVFRGFSHCFTLFPIGCIRITLFEFIICVFKKASNQIRSALHLKIDALKKPRDQENHRENQKSARTKKKQTTLVLFRKRGPSPRPLRFFFVFVVFSTVFCFLEYFVDFVQFRILLHFQWFLALFAALADCILDAERQMTPWLTVRTCSFQWNIVIQCKDAFYVNRRVLRCLNFRGGSFFSLYNEYFPSLWECLCTSYTH